jgi:hypothetical protein
MVLGASESVPRVSRAGLDDTLVPFMARMTEAVVKRILIY